MLANILAALGLLAASVFASAPAAAQSASAPISVVAFGDSLSAGYRLQPAEAFPARLEAALRAAGHDVNVANAGVSGDTTAGGLARLERAVPADADIVIVELGANDMLRGAPPVAVERNLDGIVSRLAARGQRVIVAGMIAPPQLGNAYTRSFNPIFGRVADRYGATLYPFFLDGIAGRRDLNLGDGIHPNAAGVERIVEGILPTVDREVRQVSASR